MGISAIVADNHPDVRSALLLLLEEKPGISVISEVSKASELLTSLSSAMPDLVLLDWELPGLKAEELMSLVHGLYPSLPVIVLSSPPEKLLDVLDKFIPE